LRTVKSWGVGGLTGVELSVAEAEQRIRKIMTGASQIAIDVPARILP
jgi:hypothetical protein